ncbi:Set domain-containing hypothetical protein [Phytophthora megakarya]|uniref:SET domain-containing protein n=1 Tax=Phytophthora megakarya TaxID=4795 RepID=A0A225VF80_9STRA|nr:Set domain-containing hypothetical protein [Phytophthora megakarya]
MWSTLHFVVMTTEQAHFSSATHVFIVTSNRWTSSTREVKMSRLSVAELPEETLRAGDKIEYFSRVFVCGDKRGHRSAVVVRIDSQDDLYPVCLDTEELLPLDNLMRRTADMSGKCVMPNTAKWRKLRTYKLVDGTFDAPINSSTLNSALAAIVHGAFESAHQVFTSRCEVSTRDSAGMSRAGDSETLPPLAIAKTSSTSVTYPSGGSCSKTDVNEVSTSTRSAESDVPATRKCVVINLVSSSDTASDSGDVSEAGTTPTGGELLDANNIPNRYARARIRHQKKRRAGEWHVSRSRKRRDQRKCAVTRSGNQIHHAHTVTALKMKKLLAMVTVKLRLVDLHERRKAYTPAVHDPRFGHAEVPWPEGVEQIEASISNEVVFPDLGDFGVCRCESDCFMDTCDNAIAAVFCTPSSCKLGALCSNTPRVRETLKLFDTQRVGLSVYTTADMDVGDIVGEYTGELREYDAVVPGQPPIAVKQNSGYTLLMRTKSVRKKYVYVDALHCGSITRYISHSCDPNAVFVEAQNGADVKVLVRMLKDVKAGAQITVHYGDETWFTCMCDTCWKASGVDAMQNSKV